MVVTSRSPVMSRTLSLIIGFFFFLPCLVHGRVDRSSSFRSSTHTDLANDPHAPSTSNTTISDLENHVFPPSSQGRIAARAGGLKQPQPASDAELTTAAGKGCNMLYLMSATQADALTRMQAMRPELALTTSESKWDNAGMLKTYGWTEKKPDNINWPYLGVGDMIEALKIDKNDKNGMNYQLLQDTAVTVGGKAYAASGGTYNQAINPAAGLIMAYYIYSPAYEAKQNNVKGDTVPLAQYSDVLFLEYSKLAGRVKPAVDVKKLQYFVFANIENPNTWGMVLKALMNKNKGSKDIVKWPGTTISMNDPEGKALLSTQIGNPLAWMLAQHKGKFGSKTVDRVTIWRNNGMTNQDTDQPYPSLLFYVKDVKTPVEPHCDPTNLCCCPDV